LKNNTPVNLQNVSQKLSQEQTSWSSEKIGYFNENQVNVRFMSNAIAEWHTHAGTDEMFVVLSEFVIIDTEYESLSLAQNDCFIVKAGIRHRVRPTESATLMTLIGKNTLV
jgi:mannose-6-phosphate isomerase-like protein (cupin superfamily)